MRSRLVSIGALLISIVAASNGTLYTLCHLGGNCCIVAVGTCCATTSDENTCLGSDSNGMFYEMTKNNIQGAFKSYFAGTADLYMAHCIVPGFDDVFTLRPAASPGGEGFNDSNSTVTVAVVPLSPDQQVIYKLVYGSQSCLIQLNGCCNIDSRRKVCLYVDSVSVFYRMEVDGGGSFQFQSYFVNTTATNYFAFCQANDTAQATSSPTTAWADAFTLEVAGE
jgi:hypothetical protein